jgi:predicted HTH domain antitoxin
MRAITVHLDDEFAAILAGTPEELEELAREALVLELFRRHAISAGRATRALGLTREAFMKLASSRGIPVIDTTPEQWQAELAAIESWSSEVAAREQR